MTPPRPGLATAAFLHAHGIDVRPDTLAALLEEAVERLACSLYPPHPRDDLTEGEAAALERGGFDLEPRAQGRDDPLVRSAAEYGALLRASLTTSEAAERLGVDSSRIRQRLGASPPTLYGIRSRSGWRLPAFQFHGDGLVPGVGPVLAGLDAELHPVAVQRWFLAPHQDLVVPEETTGTMVSPRDWLLAGLAVEPVARLAGSL